MVETDGSGGGRDPAERAIEETRRTIDYQYRTLADVDSKASRLLQINLVVVGLVLTGLSVSVGSPSLSSGPLVNSYTATGVTLLLVSTVLAGVTYTATKLRIGVDADTVRQMLSGELSDGQIDRGLAKSYARWIEENERSGRTNARLISATIATGTYAIVVLAAGGLVAYSRYSGVHVPVALLLVGLLIAVGMEWQRVERWFR